VVRWLVDNDTDITKLIYDRGSHNKDIDNNENNDTKRGKNNYNNNINNIFKKKTMLIKQ